MSAWKQRLALPVYIARHPANRGHIASALARSFAFQVRARLTRAPAVAQIGSMRMWVHIGNAAATKVVYGSPPDWPEMQAWARILSSGDLFVDVGANVGTYSLWAAGSGAEVIAVEPEQQAAGKLRQNVALNPDARITVVEAAASDRQGSVEITVGQDTLTRIGKGREVPSATLDALVGERHVRGVKIDVEGFERLVLEGAKNLLAAARVDAWQLEWNGASREALGQDRAPVADLLRGAGYILARPDDDGRLRPEASLDFGADMFAVLPALLDQGA